MQYKNLKNIKAENQRNRQSERLKNDITRRLLNYLERKYEMRYNTALGCTEIRKAGSDEPFVPADERMRNTIAIKARLDGIDAWDKDIRDVCCSDERGNTWQRKLLLTIRLTEFDACKLHDILQKTILRLSRQGIELINIYQQRLAHCPQRILLLTHDKIIVISPLQRLR